MTDHPPHPTNSPSNDQIPDDLCIAAMLRACADGELCSEECDRLKKYLAEHPEADCQIEFEKALKSCCDRVMSEPCCPDDLRSKIESLACDCMTARAIDQSNTQTRKPSFWKLSPMMSAAAAILILAGGTLIWQSSSIIMNNSGLSNPTTTPVTYAQRIGDFVAREHMRCCQDKAGTGKLKIESLDEATKYFSGLFGKPVCSPRALDESVGEFQFFGGGDCHLPATQKSGHMRFDAIAIDGSTIHLSLFVAPDPGLLGIEQGTTYQIKSTMCGKQGANLFVWLADGVLYLLVSEADDKMCAPIRDMMNAPTTLRQL